MIKQLLIVLFALLPVLVQASNVPVNYTGHYELADGHQDRIFTFDLIQNKSKVHLTFFASLAGDAVAQPMGKGQGRITDQGSVEFSFKDNFANEGTATLQPMPNGYQIEMRVTKFVDAAPLHFYGVLKMKKTSNVLPEMAYAD